MNLCVRLKNIRTWFTVWAMARTRIWGVYVSLATCSMIPLRNSTVKSTFCIHCLLLNMFLFQHPVSFSNWLLFISYKFVKYFFAITFYYLLFLAETFMMSVNVFYITRNKNIQPDPTKIEKFLHRPPL